MLPPNLILVIPCYNEQEALPATNARLMAALSDIQAKGQLGDFAMLYVDDGSGDHTWSEIKRLADCNQKVKGLKLSRNVGQQQAIWAGLEAVATSTYDAVVTIDADLQDDVEALPIMLKKHAEGADIVYGVRCQRGSDGFFKRHSAQTYYKLLQKLGGEVVYNHADYRLMSLRVVKALLSFPERNLYLRGMMPLIGFTTAEVYYNHQERVAGKSKYPISKMLSFGLDGITSFSVRPLHFITVAGVVVVVLSLAAIVYALVAYFRGYVFPGWTSLLISTWFIGGCILTALGMIGEYIGKIYKEVKRRPRYFIESKINL